MSSSNNSTTTKSRSASPRTSFPTNTKATSLCIPRVFKNITQDRIARCFALALGVEEREPAFIDRIDMVARTDKNGQEFWRVFIHLNDYPGTPEGREVQKRISGGGTVTIVYDDPWYWKVSMSRIARPNQHKSRPRPFIVEKNIEDICEVLDNTMADLSAKGKKKSPRRQRSATENSDGEENQASTRGQTTAMMNDAAVAYCDP